MSKQALAVKYRPKRFSEVVEQDVTKSILCEQLENKTFKNCLLFCGGAGTGKAQPMNSKVLTPRGFIPMKKVKVGIDIITGSGKVAKVSEIYPQGKRDTYKIVLSNGDKIEVSDEHINVVYKDIEGKFVESNITTTELINEDYTNLFMRKISPQLGINAYYSISEIKFIGKKKCQCIYIDAPEHTYVTDNHIVTHNTTSARIFANEINDFKGKPIEIDAASNNSVEDVRKLIEQAKTQSLDSEYKVFILDECHMLSNAAWNALLKLIEEPPAKTVLMLCTTDPQKIPDTILSRVQRYNFQKISQEGIVSRLKYIIQQENDEYCESHNNEIPKDEADANLIEYEDSALEHIAKTADGGMRDSITLMDKAIGFSNKLTLNNVLEALGSVNYDTMFNLTDGLNDMDKKKVIDIVEKVHRSGLDIKQFIKQYNLFILDVCKYDLFRDFTYLQLPNIYKEKLDSYDNNAYAFFNQLLSEVSALSNNLKYESMPKAVVEATFLQLCTEA